MIDLRGHTSDRKFMTAAKEVLGLDLPKTPRTSTAWGDVKALWLSPDQWLILTTEAKRAGMVAALKAGLAKTHALAVDVSDMRAIIRIEGDEARNVLLKGSSLDLHGPDYTPGAVRRFRFAEIAALLDVVEEDAFDIYVFRSYAEYVWAWLLKAARAGTEVKAFGRQDTPAV
jgi:sarcosine oxidase subunit gamma